MSVVARLRRIIKAKLYRYLDGASRLGGSEGDVDSGWADELHEEQDDEQADEQADKPGKTPYSGKREQLAVLGLDANSTYKDIRSAYLTLCKQYHPDRFSSNPEKLKLANELLREINRAYRELTDEVD